MQFEDLHLPGCLAGLSLPEIGGIWPVGNA